MIRDRKEQDSDGGAPRVGNYPAVGAVVIGLAVGISIAAVTREAAFMLAGLAAGALVAYLIIRPAGDRDRS